MSKYTRYLIASVIFLFVFIIYLLTLCPTVYIHDSGELITASWVLGIAHPAGSPLYCMMGKLFGLLIPLGSVVLRYNLFSAFFGALSVVTLYYYLRRDGVSLNASVTAALGLAFTLVFWSESVVAEVYTFNTFLLILPLIALTFYSKSHNVKYLYLFAFLWGLLLSNHMGLSPVTPLLWVGLCVYHLRVRDKDWKHGMKLFVFMSLAFLLTFSIYIYLPLRSLVDPAVDWGNPENLRNFYAHLTAKRIQGRMLDLPFWEYIKRIGEFILIMWNQFYIFLILSVAGAIIAWKKNRLKIGILILLFFTDFVFVVFMDNAPLASEAYGIPSTVILAILLGYCLDYFEKLGEKISYSFFFIPLALLIVNYQPVDRTHNFITYDSALNILRNCEQNSVLFNREDNKTFPLAYMNTIEHRRRDITFYDRYGNMFENPYGEQLFRLQDAWKTKQKVEKKIIKKAYRTGQKMYYTDSYLEYELDEKFKLYPRGPVAVIEKQGKDNISEPDLIVPRGKNNENVYKDWMTEAIISMNHMNMGDYFWGEGQKDKALKYYRIAGEHMNRYPELHFILGQSLLSKGYPNKGAKHLRAVVKQKHSFWRAHFKLGIYEVKKGDYKSAVTYFKNALRYQKNHSYIYENLANAQRKLGLFPKAVNNYKKALNVNGENWKTYFNLAGCFEKIEEMDKAIKFMKKSFKIKKELRIGAELAQLQMRDDRLWKSRETAKKLVSLYQNSYKPYMLVGDAGVRLGLLRNALSYYRKAANISPDNLNVQYKIASVLEKTGGNHEAVKAWEHFIKIAKSQNKDKAVSEGKRRIQKLKNEGTAGKTGL